MANRFDKTYDQQPWVSSYVPLPLKDIELGYKEQQKKYDDAMAAVANEPVITGGNSTKTVAQGLENEKNNFLKSVVDEAVETKDYGQVKNKIKAYRNQLEANPYYQGILIDKTLSPAADATIVGDKDRQVAQDFYDYDKGEYNQITGRPFTAGDYAAMAPPDTQKIFDPYYKQLEKRIIDSIDPALKPHLNADGTITYFQNGVKETRSLSREEVRKLAEPMMADASFRALDPFGYNKLRHKQIFGKDILDANGNVIERGSQWDEYNDPLDIFAANYLGSKYEQDRTSSAIYTTKADDGGGRKATSRRTGGGNDDDGGIENVLRTIAEDVYTDKFATSADGKPIIRSGTATIGKDQLGGLVGGIKGTDGRYQVDFTNKDLFYVTTEQIDLDKENVINNKKAIYLQDELNQMKKKVVGALKKYQESGSAEWVHPKTGNSYYIDLEGNIHERLTNGTKRIISEEDFGNTQSEYVGVKNKALSVGIDLDSEEIKKSIKLNTEDDPKLVAFNKALEKGLLNGRFKVDPASDKDNVITDGEGNMYASMYVDLNEDQLGLMMPDNAGFGDGWKSLRDHVDENGNPDILLPYIDEKGKTSYRMPVTIKVDNNTDNLTRDVDLATYGPDNETQREIKIHQGENRVYINYMKGLKQSDNIRKFLDNGKIDEKTLDFDKYAASSPEIKQALEAARSNKDPKEKNKDLADIWLYINNNSAWKEHHGIDEEEAAKQQQISTGMGKPASGTRK